MDQRIRTSCTPIRAPSGRLRGCRAPGSQKRSEGLSSVRMMRASVPAAIVATQSVRHRSPVRDPVHIPSEFPGWLGCVANRLADRLRALRTRGIVINNAPSQTELSQKAASLSFEALERFPKMHFPIQEMNRNGLCCVLIGTVQRSDRRRLAHRVCEEAAIR